MHAPKLPRRSILARSASSFALFGGLVAIELVASVPASAAPFATEDLFVSHTMKSSSSDRHFTGGVNVQVAPVKALEKKLVTDQVNNFKASNPAIAPVVDSLKYVDTKQLKALADSGQVDQVKALIVQQAKDNGHPLSTQQQDALKLITSSNIKTLATVVDIYNQPPQSALTFSLEPYAELNTKWLAVKTQVAVAGFHTDSGNSLELGNIGLSLKTGDAYGPSGAAFGWSLGCDVWLPTGTANSDAVALSNILATPRYAHSYLSAAPFAVIGVDLPFVDLILRGQFVNMTPVRDKEGDILTAAPAQMQYSQIGGAVILDAGFVGISAEIDGLQDIKNAPNMNNVWLGTLGIRGYFAVVQAGIGVQVPLVKATQAAHTFGPVSTGEIASFNVLGNLLFKL